MPGLITFSGCEPCTLRKEWPYLKTPRMPFTGPTEPSTVRLLALGEGPGDTEDRLGKQFVGVTGQYLKERIPRDWVNKLYWQNIVRCQPPRNRTPTDKEMECCSEHLEKDILQIRPHAILGLGSVPLNYFVQLTEAAPTITKFRGIPLPVRLDDGTTSWFFPTLHPSYVVRGDRKNDTGQTINTIEPVFRNDLNNFFKLAVSKFLTPPKMYDPPKNILYPRSYEEAWSLFLRLKEPYAKDFETFKTKPYRRDAKLLTCACSDGDLTFAFPVEWPGDINPWGLRLLTEMYKHGKAWIAQNSTMELSWARYKSKIRELKFDDTELLARIVHQRTGMGRLEVLSRIYLGFDVKAINTLDKNRMNEYPLDKVLPYNALDAWSTYIIYTILTDEISKSQTDIDNYLRSLQSVESTVEMELRGLTPDISQSEAMQKDLFDQEQEISKKCRQIKEVKEYERTESKYFNVGSPDNVAAVLTRYCGIQLPKNEDTKKYTTDEDALTELAGEHPLVDHVLSYREVSKQLSTYVEGILDGTLIGVDGLLHPSYTVAHTATWRLSARDPNIQNFPKRKNRHIRRQIVAPPGHLLVSFDYGGLEVRGIQMASKDENLRRAIVDPQGYLHDKDLHWYWLHRLLDLYPPYINRLAEVSGETEHDKIIKGGRTIIKTDFVFATFYGSTARAVANRTQIPVEIIDVAHEELWNRFPQTEKWTVGQFEFYKNNGYIQSLTGRVRNDVLPGHEITNNPIQGTGAEIVLEAQNALYSRAIIDHDDYLFPRINIHDDLTFILPDNNDTEKYIRVIADEMTKPRFPFISCPLLVECSIGYNWCDIEQIAEFTGKTYEEEYVQAYTR